MNQEINKIVNELYLCLPNDRNKFDSIMKNLREQFLSSNYSEKFDYNKKFPKTNFSSQLLNDNKININNIPTMKNNDNQNYLVNSSEINPSLNPLKANYNLQPINLPTFNVQNKQYDGLNTDNLGEYININNNDYQIGNFNENMYENELQNDVHANYKYYYPEEFSSQFNSNDKSQNFSWKTNNMNDKNLNYGSYNNNTKINSGI